MLNHRIYEMDNSYVLLQNENLKKQIIFDCNYEEDLDYLVKVKQSYSQLKIQTLYCSSKSFGSNVKSAIELLEPRDLFLKLQELQLTETLTVPESVKKLTIDYKIFTQLYCIPDLDTLGIDASD